MPDPKPSEERTCEDCRKIFVAKYAKYCARCRPKHRRKRTKKYDWTPERETLLRNRYDSRVKGRAAEIAKAFGWPCWVIKRHARHLGLSHSVDRQDWSDEEVQFLVDHAGDRSTDWIAKKLRRSVTSVVMKFKHMKISRRVRSGYTMTELQLCFGTDHHVITRWMREGKLACQRRPTDRKEVQGGDPLCVSEEAILEFIQNHPMAFRLDKVDQFWFMDLILNGGLVKKALETAREEAA